MEALISLADGYAARCHPVSQLKRQVRLAGEWGSPCCRFAEYRPPPPLDSGRSSAFQHVPCGVRPRPGCPVSLSLGFRGQQLK